MNKYYLATTGISNIWDFDKELLLLGPWCVTNNENKELLRKKSYKVISSPFKPGIKIKEADDYCYDIYVELLPKISESLNGLHNVSYTQRYWQILLGYWLMFFIEIVYDRYKRIEHAFDIFPDIYTHVIPYKQSDLATVDTYDALSLNGKINNDYYNLTLFSLIAHYLHPDKTVKINYKNNQIVKNKGENIKRRLWRLFINCLGFFNHQSIFCDMSHLHPFDLVLLKLRVGANKIGFRDFNVQDVLSYNNFSTNTREVIKLEQADDKFRGLLYKILPFAIPMCYVENYPSYKDKVGSTKNVLAVGSTGGWYFNEGFKFFAALSASNGAKLLDFQHGGGYGVGLSVPHEKTCLEKDIFFTWGWKDKNNKTDPLPVPYLSKIKDEYYYNLNKPIFVSTSMPKYQYKLESCMQPEDMFSYVSNMKIFFKSLSNEIIKSMLFRPNFEGGWNITDTIKKEYPNISIVTIGKLIDLMKKVKLVIIDHAHTSFLEALVINVPTILYWDHDIFLMRPEAEEYFELLRNVGILYKDPVSAAKKVNEIYNDPQTWWNQLEIQNARNKFCQKFALTSKNWLDEWKRALENTIIGAN